MNRKDSKRKSRLELSYLTVSSNGVCAPVKSRQSQSRRRRRMTCPSPAEINKALVTVTLAQLGKGCTLEELMEKCIQSFDVDGKLWRNEDTVHMIIVMHSWVVPSADFARKLLQLYREAAQSQRRMQICHFLRFWVNQYPEVFRLDSELEELMCDFWEVVKDRRRPSDHRQSIDTSYIFDQEITRTFPESPSFNKKRKVSLLFDHLEPSELADHLSYLEFICFCRISHLDYRSYTLQSSLREIPRLERSVTLCNSISQWVQLMILNRLAPQQRAEVFTKFIQVTQKLRKRQNFNTLMAVIGGLCHSAISRLKETHSYLSQDVLKSNVSQLQSSRTSNRPCFEDFLNYAQTLSEMTELLSSSSNYSTYRRVYNECEGFKIPILGVQLKDLVSLNEALPDYLDNGKINVSKLQSLYQHILELRQLQKANAPFKANKDVILLLTTSLDMFYTEDEIYTLSYTREPRIPKLLPPTSNKPPTEIPRWTPDVSLQLDPETISHKVEQMVESVFRFYDKDQRGSVSREDFEKVVSSLPFSCHILEKDHEGPVNHQEMTLYFMKASQVCSKLGVPFLQSLVEIRLKESPLCASCIWAVAKQGYVSGGSHKDVMQRLNARSTSPQSRTETRGLCQKSCQTDGPLGSPGPVFAESPAHLKPHYEESCKRLNARSTTPLYRTERRGLCQKSCQTDGPLGSLGPMAAESPTHPKPHCGESCTGQQIEMEKERDRLLMENAGLHCTNSQLAAENARLQSQLSVLQERVEVLSLDTKTPPAINEILDALNALQVQCDESL